MAKPIKIGILVNEKGELITLTSEEVESKFYNPRFEVFSRSTGKYDKLVEATFIETEDRSRVYDAFGLTDEQINVVLFKYDELKTGDSIVFRTDDSNLYSASITSISKAAFEAKNLKITLKALTQEEKINIIKTKVIDVDKLLSGTLAIEKKDLKNKRKKE